jgi:putative AlgH/UPF0301 family transcriptional regulator
MIANFKGKLLVARPGVMTDPRFKQTVVYLYEQTPEVVLGLILNKKTTTTIAELHAMRGNSNSGAYGYLHNGGPVSDQSLLLLHTDEWSSTNTMLTTHGNAISSDELMLEKMLSNNMPLQWRLMSGISTWTLPQLQKEIYHHGGWLIVEPRSDIFYTEDGEDQWKSTINLASMQLVDSFF